MTIGDVARRVHATPSYLSDVATPALLLGWRCVSAMDYRASGSPRASSACGIHLSGRSDTRYLRK